MRPTRVWTFIWLCAGIPDMKQINTKASSTAYEAIRSMVAQGQLCPGEELSERRLAESLQLGRTPVREAIKELCREGVLMSVPLRGTFVQRLSVEDLKEIHEVRLALEGMAAKLAAEKGGSPELRACMAYPAGAVLLWQWRSKPATRRHPQDAQRYR